MRNARRVVVQQCEPDTPLIAALTSERTTTPRLSAPRIYTIVKRLIQYGASSLQAAGRAEEARHMNGLARAHTLRHTFGTMAAEKNLPAVVQSWMGHSDVKTTMGYFSPRADVQFKLLDERFDNPAGQYNLDASQLDVDALARSIHIVERQHQVMRRGMGGWTEWQLAGALALLEG